MKDMNSSQVAILLIDDEADLLANLASVLQDAGYKCHGASDAQSAAQVVRKVPVDLIISDINLAGHSGLALCEQLKQEEGLLDVPVMFLSGAQIPDVIRRSHAAGGTYYLRKPFDPSVLLELVDKALWMPHIVGAQMARS